MTLDLSRPRVSRQCEMRKSIKEKVEMSKEFSMSSRNQPKQALDEALKRAHKPSRAIKLFRRLSTIFEVSNAASKIVDFLLLIGSIEPIRRVFEDFSIT
jgi:hypothetical protein